MCPQFVNASVVCDSVHVHPQRFSVHRTIRYFAAENEYLRSSLTLPAPQPVTHFTSGGVATAHEGGDGTGLGLDGLQSSVYCADASLMTECTGTWVRTAHRHPLSRKRHPLVRLSCFWIKLACLRVHLVVVWQEKRVLRFKYRTAAFPSTGDFYLLLYNDRYMASLMEVWHVVVHSTMRYVEWR